MINLGTAVYYLLTGATHSYVGSNIFPLEIPEGTVLPIIVYERSTPNIEYSRDGLALYDSIVTIYILTAKYIDGITIGSAIIQAINNKEGQVNGINIASIRLKTIEETVTDQIFNQKLEFNIKSF